MTAPHGPVPKQIGRFVLLGDLGRGGMGAVYRALEPATGRAVALKVLLSLNHPTARKRFVREAEALAKVSHPNVVQLLEFGATSAGEPFLAMELIEGEPLQRRLDLGGPLAVEQALEIARVLCGAVSACHEAGVLHRDLKPDNVLSLPGGGVKLTDFGLAHDVDPSTSRSRLTMSGACLGSPGYWAPEQARGELSQISQRTDVYGLGALLFALLTGHPPHSGQTLVEVLAALDQEKPAPSSLNPAVPAWLDGVVARALATQPERRYPTVDALGQALVAPVSPASAPSWARPVAAGVAVMGLLGALGIASVRAARPAVTPTDPRQQASAAPAVTPTDPQLLAAPRKPESVPEPIAVSAQDDPTAAAKAAFDRGVVHSRAGRSREALECYSEAIRLAPDSNAGVYLVRARERLGMKDWAGAREDCDVAVRLKPGWSKPYLTRARARSALSDRQGALADYATAIRLAPDDPAAFVDRGVERGRAGDGQGALADYDAAIRLSPNDPAGPVNRGNEYAKQGRWQAAIDDWELALRLAPGADWAPIVQEDLETVREKLLALETAGPPADLGRASFERGLAHVQAKRHREALAEFTEAIRVGAGNPMLFRAYHNRGSARLALGDPQGASDDYTEALRLVPDYVNAYLSRAQARRALSDFQGASEDASEVIRLAPDSGMGYLERASARALLGEWRGARDDCARALELEPNASWADTARQGLEIARQRLEEQGAQGE